MKILFISDNFPPERNAAASRVYERAAFWVRWGHDVTVLTSAPNFPEGKVYSGYRNHWYKIEYIDGIRVVRLKTFISPNQGVIRRTIDFLSFMVASSTAGLFQARPDVIVATTPQFFCGLGGCLLARARKIPFILELSDLWPASISAVGAMRQGSALRAVSKLELFMYLRSTKIAALTQSFKIELTARGVKPNKIAVVTNGVDLGRYSARSKDVELNRSLGFEGRFVVAYIGTHGMAHALERVLDAAALLRDVPVIRFLMVGAGSARKSLEDEAKRRALDNVVFVPAQPKSEIQRYWSLCDLALVHLKNSPVFSTVIPSKMFEAMGMGCPILIAAPEGEATRIVRDTQSGVVVEPENPPHLVNAINRLFNNGKERNRLAANSLRAAPAFTRERQAREFLSVLDAAVIDYRHTEETASMPEGSFGNVPAAADGIMEHLHSSRVRDLGDRLRTEPDIPKSTESGRPESNATTRSLSTGASR